MEIYAENRANAFLFKCQQNKEGRSRYLGLALKMPDLVGSRFLSAQKEVSNFASISKFAVPRTDI